MPVTGTLETMSIFELMRWLEQNKTGELVLQQGKLTQTLWVEQGLIAGFCSNDPPSLLGQYLLSRGKIDEQTLNRALTIQEDTGENLGVILVNLDAISEQELRQCVKAKAEEAILKMFEWDNASFQFNNSARRDPKLVRLDLRIEKLLVEGIQRREEMDMMKRALGGPGIVLCRTDKPLGRDTAGSAVARRIFELVDGKRSFAEILLLSRASEYLVTKFLYELNRRGVVRVREDERGLPVPGAAENCCDLADDLTTSGEYEAAMDILKYAQTVNTGDTLVDKKLGVIESIFLNKMYSGPMPPQKVPTLLCAPADIASIEGLKPAEYYVLSLIAEHDWTIETLVRLAPMYEVDVVRALKKLLSVKAIRLDDAECEAGAADGTERSASRIDEALSRMGDDMQALTQTDRQG